MGFSTLNDLSTEVITNAKSVTTCWYKTDILSVAGVAQKWYDLSTIGGHPSGHTFQGTALTWTPCDETTGNGTTRMGIHHGGNVSPDTKHILNLSTSTSESGTPGGILMLVDLQGYWPGVNNRVTSTQTLSGTPGSNLRYANGAGCRLYLVQQSAMGTTTQTVSLSYTNQAGTTGRNLPYSVFMQATSGTAQSIAYTNENTFNNFDCTSGPFLPLAEGDTGVANVASVTFSANSTGGLAALCLARPLLTIPIWLGQTLTERNYITEMTGLPRVRDGACLTWLWTSHGTTAISTDLNGFITFGWG